MVDHSLLESQIHMLISGANKRALAVFFHRYHEADIADALESMREDQRLQFFRQVKPELAAEVLEAMDSEFQRDLISELKTELAAQYIGQMEPDDAADLIEDLKEGDEAVAARIMQALPKKDAEELEILMAYPEDSAGTIMTPEFIWIPEDLTVQEAQTAYKNQDPPNVDASLYVFVVDQKKKLKGYISVRDLILSEPYKQIKEIRNDYPIKIPVTMDQEAVARTIQKYGLFVAPVVNDHDVLVGIITVDDIVEVVIEEATEDFLKLSGTAEVEESTLLKGHLFESVKSRIPWLFLTIAGGFLASYVVTSFSVLYPTQFVSLALVLSFLPLLMGLGGNVGNQSATIIVRGISIGVLNQNKAMRYIGREAVIGLLIGGSIGFLVWGLLIVLNQPLIFSSIVAVSLAINMFVAATIGAGLPIFLYRVGVDPAVASAPFISTALDIIGQIIYFLFIIGVVTCLL